jgi:hypothetical protein
MSGEILNLLNYSNAILWQAVLVFNQRLEISLIHFEISLNELDISLHKLEISLIDI